MITEPKQQLEPNKLASEVIVMCAVHQVLQVLKSLKGMDRNDRPGSG